MSPPRELGEMIITFDDNPPPYEALHGTAPAAQDGPFSGDRTLQRREEVAGHQVRYIGRSTRAYGGGRLRQVHGLRHLHGRLHRQGQHRGLRIYRPRRTPNLPVNLSLFPFFAAGSAHGSDGPESTGG